MHRTLEIMASQPGGASPSLLCELDSDLFLVCGAYSRVHRALRPCCQLVPQLVLPVQGVRALGYRAVFESVDHENNQTLPTVDGQHAQHFLVLHSFP